MLVLGSYKISPCHNVGIISYFPLCYHWMGSLSAASVCRDTWSEERVNTHKKNNSIKTSPSMCTNAIQLPSPPESFQRAWCFYPRERENERKRDLNLEEIKQRGAVVSDVRDAGRWHPVSPWEESHPDWPLDRAILIAVADSLQHPFSKMPERLNGWCCD